MKKNFYHAFEDRFRGDRELIKFRQAAYLPYIEMLKKGRDNLTALDLGCGRGEWLELLGEWGVKGEGVDLDSSMLSECWKLGLNAINKNALTALAEANDDSLDIISAFHLAEHLNFSDLIILVQQSLRVLRPGGILILETPNSENINVATSSFYLDPTHQNPLPRLLVSFLYEYAGFSEIKEVLLNADINLRNDQWISLKDVFFGVSRDYGIVGQKAHLSDASSLTSIRFIEEKGGVYHSELIDRFDNQTHHVNAQIEEKIAILSRRISRLERPFELVKKILRSPHTLYFRTHNYVQKEFKKLKGYAKKILIYLLKKLGLYSISYTFYYRFRERLNYEALTDHAKEIYSDLKDGHNNMRSK